MKRARALVGCVVRSESGEILRGRDGEAAVRKAQWSYAYGLGGEQRAAREDKRPGAC